MAKSPGLWLVAQYDLLMPSCFQLFSKDNPTDAVSLSKVDEEICSLLNIPVHNRFYGNGEVNWFDTIGYMIATSNDLQLGVPELRDKMKDWELDKRFFQALDYLEENYTSTSFYQTKG